MKQLIQIEKGRVVRQISLKKKEYKLGRGIENDLVFDTSKVSRLHAMLIRERDSYTLMDQQSTNHVFVNGEQIKSQTLASGDEINLSKEITLLYLSDRDTENQVTELVDHMWDFLNKRDFLQLREVTKRIVSLDSLDNILNIIIEEVVRLVGAERGFIALADKHGEIRTDTSIAHNIPLHEDQGEESVFSHSTIQRAIQQREKVFVLNAENERENLSESVLELELQSVMCAPLLFGEKLVGILYVDSGYQFFDFNEMDRFFFSILSDHAAIAIENAKLYSQVNTSVQQLRAEVSESEERYRHTLEATPDPISIIRIEDGRIIQVNEAFCSTFGYCSANVLNKTVPELHLFIDEGVFAHFLEMTTQKQDIKNFEATVQRNDAAILEVLLSARVIRFAEDECMIMVATDITVRKKAEDALQRAKEAAESANRTKSEFLGRMSHELRTPMNIIMGMTQLISETGVNPQQQIYLDKILKASNMLLELISDILDFSRIETGTLRIESMPFHLPDILNNLLQRIRISAEAKGLLFHVDVSREIPPLLIGDPFRLQQVVLNLLDNAVKFTENGTITLHVSRNPQNESGPDRITLLFAISDTGIGISQEALAELFKPFTQVDGSMTRRYGGTGIGLAICQRLVAMMNGKLWVESVPGQGSTFSFCVELGRRPEKGENTHIQQLTDDIRQNTQTTVSPLEKASEMNQIPPDLAEIKPQLKKLLVLLEEGNTEAVECLKSLEESLLGTELAPLFQSMTAQIHHYNFEDAQKTLDDIIAMLQDTA